MSNKEITDSKKEKIKPSIDGSNVVVRKKSKGQKVFESFLGDEVDTVKDHILYDMIIPSSKDALSNMCGSVVDFFNDMFHEFIDTIFFGSSGSAKTKASETYVSYQGYYNKGKQNNRSSRQSSRTYSRHDLDDLEYPDMETALIVRKDIIDRINNYNEVSVAELFSLSGKTLDWTEEKEKDKIGWSDPEMIGKPRRRRGKYIIPLAKPEKLRD